MKEKLRGASLFLKIALVGVAGMAAVAACTLLFALRATERAYVQTLSLSNQQVLDGIKDDMESANDLVTRLMMCMSDSTAFKSFLTSDGSNPTAFQNVYEMAAQLSAVSPLESYDAMVLSADGSQWYSSTGTSLALPAQELLEGELAQQARLVPNRIHYKFMEQGITKRSASGVALVAFKAMAVPSASTPYGYGFVVIPQEDLQAFYSRMSTPANTLLLVDADGTVVSATDASWVGRCSDELNDAIARAESDAVSAVIDGHRSTVQSVLMAQWDLRLVTVLDRDRALRELNGRGTIFAACVMVCAVVLVAFFLILRQITRPIQELVQVMHTASREHLSDHVAVQGSMEARQLAEAFNSMMDDIQSYVDRVVTLEKEKKNIELQALQMQIKPHFVYNTLASIKWLVWQKETDKAAHCIDDLTVLLRSTLGDQQRLITVSEEMDLLKSYVYLQQVRFGDRIRVSYFLSEDAAGCRMPKLLLQPLVENAFFHAFVNRPAGGTISVFVTRKDSELICEVMDDGIGMASDTAEKMLAEESGKKESGSGIGLANVNRRIKLRYGEDYGVRIFSKPDHGTTVRIRIPASDENQK